MMQLITKGESMVTLLLNSSYEPIRFIDMKRALKLIYKDKVDIVDSWEGNYFKSINASFSVPATLRIRRYINIEGLRQFRCSKNGIFTRDSWHCQYCNKIVTQNSATIDHVIPRAIGGKTTWQNCVTSCTKCNTKKGSKSLSESGLKLLKEPKIPTHLCLLQGLKSRFNPHESWKNYFCE